MNTKLRSLLFLFPLLFFLTTKSAAAHCPLCTVGAAAAAGGAAYLGVDPAVIGLFVGAFAVSTGWWVSRLVKKQYLPQQKWLIILISFLLTMIPLMPIISTAYPLYIPWFGSYGSMLNRTYVINPAWITGIMGGLVVSTTPWLSKKISGLREGKVFPFQGVVLTALLLVLAGGILQLVV